jgi:conserved oligomeric Golgi complex subunit 3
VSCSRTEAAIALSHFILIPAARDTAYDAVDDLGSLIQPLMRLPSLASMSTWYPTLKKTHWVLSQLHEYVNVSRASILGSTLLNRYPYLQPAIFEDIAYEAISLCKESLISASDALSSKSKSPPDGKLFLIRHLLILKELTTALGLDVQRDRGVDFSGVTGRSILCKRDEN